MRPARSHPGAEVETKVPVRAPGAGTFGIDEASFARVRLERFEEVEAAQVMHIGPYAEEGPTIASLHAFVDQQGLDLHGKHREIYLGDPRRAAPEKLRTTIRQPIARRPG